MLAENLSDLFQRGLEFAYDGERHLLKELRKMGEAASSQHLKNAIEVHLRETTHQAERLEQIFSLLDRAAVEEPNHAIRSLTNETEKLIKHIDRSALLDSALIMAGTQIEHIEIALYGSIHSLATVLGLSRAAGLLQQTLDEEKTANRKLTELARDGLNDQAIGVHNMI